MERKTYTYDELCLMSYQELRRLSILLRLPANIKKKHMISMIEAHQKGDGHTKNEIANKVKEERDLRRMNSQLKRTKPLILSSRVRTHQVSTDLSVATKHEFETRYSYVAHYTKGNKTGIIREEAQVSRRNRSVVQQSRKLTGRTEIMLPRNHSLTSVVQLMPQYEGNYIPSSKGSAVGYESAATSAPDYPYQNGNPFMYSNLPFPPDYGNSFIASSSHELYRNLPYWHARQYESFVRYSSSNSGKEQDEARDVHSSNGLLSVYSPPDVNNYSNMEESDAYGRRCDEMRCNGENENLTYLVDIFAPRRQEWEETGRNGYLVKREEQRPASPRYQQQAVLPSFMATFHPSQSPESFASEICIDSPKMSVDQSSGKEHENAISVTMSSFSQCRYISGHNQFPESISRPYAATTTIFASQLRYSGQDCSYSLCRNTETDTTAVHVNPIMTSGNGDPKRAWNGSDVAAQSQDTMANNNVENLHHYQRSMFYSYPEDHSPYSLESGAYTNWNEDGEELDGKTDQSNSHDMRIVQCKKHGYHYIYAMSSAQ
ncbi:UNVERIFIED_CONTAM: hypothetical protein PYX00_007359 [Menopon gallinae]|uniref:Uncharacterized protein n=1 Tax=Menopon gallinae TaxID=328185 RepID=A0AAW2HIX5_9NEOP